MLRTSLAIVALGLTALSVNTIAQGLPTAQPNFVTVVREEVKIGRNAEHQRIEAGWPAAYEKAKSPDYYLAYVSMTGRPEAWYVQAFDSHKALGDSMKREEDDAVLSAELKRLSRADADVLNNVTVMHLMARKELSYGGFPDIAKQRFVEITTFRVRPGHEAQFEAAARAYGAAAKRSAPTTSYRVYEIMAGVQGPAYLIFSSMGAFGEFDKGVQDGQAIMKGASQAERDALDKFGTDALISAETERYRVDPVMSYVPKETRVADPAFWMPKKPAAAKPPSTASAQKPTSVQ